MNKIRLKASALLFVLVMLFIVTLLANVVLQIMLNQSRLSQHRIWRVKGLYAAQAGMVLTMQKLREGKWIYNTNTCINCPVGSVLPPYRETDSELPYVVYIKIGKIGDSATLPNSAPIYITVSYQPQFSGML